MKLIIHLTFLLFLAVPAFGQTTHTLKGKVITINNESIIDGVAVLTTIDDNQIIKTAIITNGIFSFEYVIAGNYTVQITSLGYDILNSNVSLNKDTSLAFILTGSPTVLSEVTIDAQKKTFTAIVNSGDVT